MKRFTVTPVDGLPDHYILEDNHTGLLCMWEKGKFNQTQEFRNIPNGISALEGAKLVREVGDYLSIKHRDKI